MGPTSGRDKSDAKAPQRACLSDSFLGADDDVMGPAIQNVSKNYRN